MPSCPGASQPCGQLASQQRWFLASGDDDDDNEKKKDDDDGDDDGEDGYGGDDEDGDGDIDANLASGWQVASQQKVGRWSNKRYLWPVTSEDWIW